MELHTTVSPRRLQGIGAWIRWVGWGWAVLVMVGLPALGGPSPSLTLEGWQNRSRQWGPVIQAGNSFYGEDQVLPLRWVGSLNAGSTHTVVLKFDNTRGGRGVFIDALAAYDATESGVDPAQKLSLSGLASRWQIPADGGVPGGVPPPGMLTTYNVRRVSFGSYSSLDGVRMLPVTFEVAASSRKPTVVLAYGVHLASELDWGVGNGALQYPGASRKAYASLNGGADLNVSVNPDAVTPTADVALTLVGPAEAFVGDEVVYDLAVVNGGPNTAVGVSVTDVLPSGVTFLGATTRAGSISGGSTVVAALGDLLPGGTASLSIRVRLESGAVGTLVNTAAVGATTRDPASANNQATAITRVTVPDRTPPVIDCPADLEVATAPGLCGAWVSFPLNAADETSAVTVSASPGTGSFFPLGVTAVTITASDASGNTATCQFQVTVVDRSPPVLECLSDILVDPPAGACEAVVGFTVPTALDICDGEVEVVSDVDPGSAFPIGRTVVTLTAADRAGNVATCRFTVTVRDAPNTTWPDARVLELVEDASVPGLLGASDRQCLVQLDQSRWYRFKAQPGSLVAVTLTDLAANYDLLVFKDVAATYAELVSQPNVTLLSAAFAPDAFSPAAFSPDALAPAAFSPAAFSPAAFSPAAFSPAAFSPAAFSPAAFSPAAFSPDAYAPAAFSPAAFSPDAFSPAAFSPAAFSPAAFSPAAFSDAQAQSVIGVSAFEGTASEGVVVNTWDSTGDFYVRVRGRNGVYQPGAPFHLQVYLLPGTCGDLRLAAVDDVGVALPSGPAPMAGDYRTLILTDPLRMSEDGSLALMDQKLVALAARPEVKGVVVNLALDPRVALFQAQADEKHECPTAKNLVAAAIREVVNAWWAVNPGLENVVLVGGDSVIPFFRYPDQSLLGPERNYVPPVRDFTASQASLRLNYVLGQDAYGARCDVPRAALRLPMPGLAVGRLVEHPAEVVAMLDAYLETPGGVVARPARALVTGYDFLVDAAEAVRAELDQGLGVPAVSLITAAHLPPAEGWTADDLREALFTARHDLVYLAGHFSAFGALAADFTTHVAASELESAAVDFKNSIFVSAGCHSAYNAVDADGIPYVTPEPDWPQACARRQATLVAGTGYQYGDTDFIEYSERLYLEFFRQLRRGTGPVSVGQALVRAKERYLATTPVMRGLHEKAYVEAALFGLPMLRVDLPAGRGGAPSDADAPVVGTVAGYATDPGRTLGLEYADLEVVPTFSPARTLELTDFDSNERVVATYYEGRDGIVNNPAEPILPLEVRNVTRPGTVLRGVGFRGGAYEDLPGILPLTGAATTEIRGVHAGFPTEVFFPVQPWSVNAFEQLCSGGLGTTRLNVAAAQYRIEDGSAITGVLRRHHRMQFRLFYSDNLTVYPGAVPSVPGRSAPPQITDTYAASGEAGVHFFVRVSGNPAAGIQEVWVTYTATEGPLAGRWQSLDLAQSAADSTVWEADLAIDGGTAPGSLRYMVQAVNGVGLVGINTRQGRYHIPDFRDGWGDPDAVPTELALLDPPTGGAFGSRVSVRAKLTAQGLPLEGRGLLFQVGDQQAYARTGSGEMAGIATATLSLATLPGPYEVKVTFPGGFGYNPSWASAPFDVVRAEPVFEFIPAAPVIGADARDSLTAVLTDRSGAPIPERTVLFVMEGPWGSLVRPVITDYTGRARLGSLALGSGSYTVTAHFAAVVPLPGDGGTVDLTDPRYEPAVRTTTLTVDADVPEVSAVTVSPSILTVPNHKMVPVTIRVAATDAGGVPVSRIVSITSSEPENGLGDGDQAPDWGITGALTAELRAERAQNGTGRTYTLVVETTDAVGNRRLDSVTVFVPK